MDEDNWKLERSTVRNCVVTRSNLVLTWKGVDRRSFFRNLDSLNWTFKTNLAAFGSLFLKGFRKIQGDGPFFHVFNSWGTGYYHWLLEVLPKFLLFEQDLKGGTVLLPRNPPRFIIEFLAAFGFSKYVELNTNLLIPTLEVISNPNSGCFSKMQIEMIRTRLRERFGVSNPSEAGVRRAIYVSRRNSRGRKVVNEEQISDALKESGVDLVELDSMGFEEQVRMFSSCSLLISIHGAALANMIFMPEGSRVVELHPDVKGDVSKVNQLYRNLSMVSGLGHELVQCRREIESKPLDLHWDNILVDPGELLARIGGGLQSPANETDDRS